MRQEPDLLIIGGGPAGTAAAIWAAQCGLSAILMERATFPRHRPGETLHPGTEALFDQLGVAEEVAAQTEIRHESQTISWAGERSKLQFGGDANGPWRGYQIPREKLDAILMARARSLGVIVCQPSSAAGMPLLSGSRVLGVMDPEPRHAKFVIDASGARGFLRRRLRLEQLAYSTPLIAYYGYGVGQSEEEVVLPSLVGDEKGWLWTAKVGRRTFNWTRLLLEPSASQLPPPLRGVDWQGPVRGADVTWRIVPDCAGPGYFLAGDAAAVLDPASSHGVLRALMSGIMAAYVTYNVISGGIRESDGARYYRNWLTTWFEHDVKRMEDLYAMIRLSPGGTRAARPTSI